MANKITRRRSRARLYARKRGTNITTKAQNAKLQWGRAIVRTQAPPFAAVYHDLCELQWGRAIVRAQAQKAAAEGLPQGFASMGARDCTRASLPRHVPPKKRARLQWGRAIVRAQARPKSERDVRAGHASMGARDCTRASPSRSHRLPASYRRFNGGARLYARKRGYRHDRRRLRRRASMGARDCTRASASRRRAGPYRDRSFNGARDCTRASRT